MWGKCEPIEQAGLFVSLARLIFFFFVLTAKWVMQTAHFVCCDEMSLPICVRMYVERC